MSKTFVAGLVAGAAVLVTVTVGASLRGHQKVEEEVFRKELLDATPVQLGVLIDKQSIHSRLYTSYQLQRAGQGTVTDLISKHPNERIVWTAVLPGLGPALEPETPEKYFRNLAKSSDAIVRGTVAGKASQVTQDLAFLFTDYDISISEIFKNNPVAPIDIGAVITVTRPGGKVLLQGVVVNAIDHSFEPLPINHDVILFLRFIPETGAYRATGPFGSFELDGSSVRPLTGDRFPPGVLAGRDPFLKTLSSVSKSAGADDGREK
jgi:hypothetical protein